MGELAMRGVDLSPLLEERNDLGLLLGEQPVDGTPARRAVAELAVARGGCASAMPASPSPRAACTPDGARSRRRRPGR